MKIPLSQAPTSALLEIIRQRAVGGGERLGDDAGKDLSTPQEWGTVKDWAEYAIDLLMAPSERFSHHVRTELLLTADQLTRFGQRTMERGAVSAGNVAVVMGKRVGEAAAALGEGLGSGFEKFWGFKPGEGLLGGAVLGLVVLGALVFVVTTPGGQAVLFGAGGGWGNVLSGVGASFPVLAETVPAAAVDALPAVVKAITVLG